MNHDEILSSIWDALGAATTHRTGFTLASLATVTTEGQPRARSVILRDFRTNPEQIFFATHAYSAKVAEIRANPQVAVTFNHVDSSVQLRSQGKAAIIEDEAERLRAWDTLAPHTQQQYASVAEPGTSFHENMTAAEDRPTAFQRFAWLKVELHQLEWLNLGTTPHQRWQFERAGNTWHGQRIVA